MFAYGAELRSPIASFPRLARSVSLLRVMPHSPVFVVGGVAAVGFVHSGVLVCGCLGAPATTVN
jgi:hypothetical protein